jgi:hypothetical protein
MAKGPLFEKLNKIAPEKIIYLAGFMDGRGSLVCQKMMQKAGKRANYVPNYTVRGDAERLKLMASWVGKDPKPVPKSGTYHLQLGKNATLAVLKEVFPYLMYRKKAAKIILDIEAVRVKMRKKSPDKAVEKMDQLHQDLLSLK